MIRRLNVCLLLGCAAALWACEDGGATGADAAAGSRPDSSDGFDDTKDPVGAGDGVGGENDGAVLDAGTTSDASRPFDAGEVDAGKRVDAGDAKPYGDDCEEVFVFDPAGVDDVKSVVLTGDYSRWSSWVPTVARGAVPMQLESDGRYYARIYLNQQVFQYKFVVNGESATPSWLADPSNCHTANDNYGGRNSVRYACQLAPSCPTDPDAGLASDAGLVADGSVDLSDAGDAGAGEGGLVPQDAGSADDASTKEDAATDLDASLDQDAEIGDQDGSVDVELGADCVEVFEVDPAKYPEFAPITSVELRGDAPLSYDEAVLSLREDADGIFRARARIDKLTFKYNVVLNGKDYARDRDYCPSADDGFGGRGTSLRSTCEVPACCENIAIAWTPASSGCADVESAAFVGQLASWGKPGLPMTIDEEGTFHISFRDAPGSYEYKILVGDAYLAAPDTNCADDGEASLIIKACVE